MSQNFFTPTNLTYFHPEMNYTERNKITPNDKNDYTMI
jgi:hypothetical protein